MRSEFGEFDAIIGTARAVYLVEAKWSGSGEVDGAHVELRPEQLRRHAAFRAYREAWQRQPSDDWADFAPRVGPALAGHHIVPPATATKLAHNLEYVLRSLAPCGSAIVDVLLFSRLFEADVAPTRCGGFRLIIHDCRPVEGSQFIHLSG